MINNLMYIELKTGYSDDGPAWIGYVKTSKSKKTIYFNDHAFQKNIGNYANYINIENGDKYWISGLKKEESNRHWAGHGKIMIDRRAVNEYLFLIGEKELPLNLFEVVDIDLNNEGVRYMEQLLIIEDDIGLNQGLSKALKADDRQIISCQDLKTAKEQLLCGGVSLILLDINLPDGSGLELLREVKENMPGIPVILLTANDTDLDIVDGLERGADDYITKPFSLSVLRARVNTQLRKQASNHKNAPIHIDLFHFDFEAMTFYVGDSKVELSKTEQKLLRLLVENRGRTMTRGDLVDRIWTDGAEYVDENALSVTIKRLRDKLGAQKYIKTIYGIGYSWVTKDE